MNKTPFEQKAEILENRIQAKIDSLADRDSGIDWFKISDSFRKVRNNTTIGALIGAAVAATAYTGVVTPETGATGLFMAFGIGSGAVLSGMMSSMSKEMDKKREQLAENVENDTKNHNKVKMVI